MSLTPSPFRVAKLFLAAEGELRSSTHVAAAAFKEKKNVKTQDGKEMTVYTYSEEHDKKKHKEKADRVEGLRKDLPKLQAKYKKDLTSDDAKTRLTALAVALLDETYERVGNDGSAEENEHYGVTTWEKQHISFSGGTAKLKYTGKSGVEHEKEVSNAKVVSALKEAVKGKKPGDRILCSNADEDECTISAGDVNEYLSEFEITAKDMRGLHANEEMKTRLKAIRSKGPKLPSDKKDREKLLKEEFKEALEGAAEAVGHSPSMLRSSYLVPGFEDAFMQDGTVLDKLSKSGSELMLTDRRAAQLDRVNRLLARLATKTESEKDEEDVERLIKPAPKLKPPRNDLARRDVQDTSSREKDPDKTQDAKDNPKPSKAASASRVALMYALLAAVEKTQAGKFKATRPDGSSDYFDDQEAANAWLAGDSGEAAEEDDPAPDDTAPEEDPESEDPASTEDDNAEERAYEKERKKRERAEANEKAEREEADPLFDADNPIPESSGMGNDGYSAEHREALVDRTMTAIERWRSLDSADRKEKASLVEAEMEDLEEGDLRKEHLEAVLRGIRIGGAIADGDKAEGIGAAAVQLIRAADKSGDLQDLAELGVIGSKSSGTSDDQAVIRRIYENLPSDEWVNVLPESHPGRDLAELLADPVESRFLTPTDRLDISRMLMDMQVAELTFVDPAASRSLPSEATAADHGSASKKLRLKAVTQPIERPKDPDGVKRVLSAMQEALRKIIGMATKDEPKHEAGDVWPKGGKFWGKAKDESVQGFDSQADAAEFAKSSPS